MLVFIFLNVNKMVLTIIQIIDPPPQKKQQYTENVVTSKLSRFLFQELIIVYNIICILHNNERKQKRSYY